MKKKAKKGSSAAAEADPRDIWAARQLAEQKPSDKVAAKNTHHVSDEDIQQMLDSMDEPDDAPPVFFGPEDKRKRAVFVAELPEVRNSDYKRQMDALKPVAGPLPLHRPNPIADARHELAREFPYAVDIIDKMLTPMAVRHGLGDDATYLEPTLLVGAPGLGKSRLARRLCEVLGVHQRTFSAAGISDAHILGVSKGFSTASPTIFTETIAECGYPNPVIIIDEIEKVSPDKGNGYLPAKLLPLLEKSEARRYHEPFLAAPVDASHLGWIFTANSLDGIPEPLKSRLRIHEMQPPEAHHLPAIIDGIRKEHAAEMGLDARWISGFDRIELEAVMASYQEHKSVRVLRRQVLHLLSCRQMLMH